MEIFDNWFSEKRTVESLKETLREEQQTRQRKVCDWDKSQSIEEFMFQEEEMKELRQELKRVQADYEQKWTNQIKMVNIIWYQSK